MRHISDEELAKYFDDGPQNQPSGAPDSDWSLDDAFANPKVGAAGSVEPASEFEAVPASTSRPGITERQSSRISRISRANVESRASEFPPLADDSLTWTGRDTQYQKTSGLGGKPIMLMVGAVALCMVVFVLFGADSGPITGNLPQIGQ